MRAAPAQTSWGGFPLSDGALRTPHWLDELPGALSSGARLLAVGNGMSYGDCGLNPAGPAISTRRLNRIQAFDAAAGILRAEAGATFADINALTIPAGWLLPVTPGTRHVTLGGAVAADVHGKNHVAQGTFGHHVRSLHLIRSAMAADNPGEMTCSPTQDSALFRATIGGLGLTGMITSVEVGLRRISSAWVAVNARPFHGLDAFLAAAKSDRDAEYFIAWFANAGRQSHRASANIRGVILEANHVDGPTTAEPTPTPRWSIPPLPTGALLNRLTLAAFNQLYFHARSRRERLRPLDAFLYPLDGIRGWNNLYGPAGFLQYQAVFPDDVQTVQAAMDALLECIGTTPFFLGTLKRFGGHAPAGMLSFARPGMTVAMDFAHRGRETLELFNRLNDIARDHGGAIYAAKDATMQSSHFATGYPEADAFRRYVDPAMSSGLARRVGLVT